MQEGESDPKREARFELSLRDGEDIFLHDSATLPNCATLGQLHDYALGMYRHCYSVERYVNSRIHRARFLLIAGVSDDRRDAAAESARVKIAKRAKFLDEKERDSAT